MNSNKDQKREKERDKSVGPPKVAFEQHIKDLIANNQSIDLPTIKHEENVEHLLGKAMILSDCTKSPSPKTVPATVMV